jgi:thioredoxin-like negative regulator of GroEL
MTLAFKRYQNDAVEIDRYLDSMENNRDLFLKHIEETAIDQSHVDYFRQEPFTFLVITEDWCIDSVQFIPVLVKLAQEIPGLEIKVLRRDEHKDLAGNYRRKDGYQAIPVIIAFDEDGNELGSLVERPEQASREMAEETRRFQEANPDLEGIRRNVDRMPEETKAKVKANSRKWRLKQQDRFASYLLEELREIIDEGRQARAA